MRRWTLLIILGFALLASAQNISTSMQIPPLQWINLSSLTKGGSPPAPLRNAHIAYDAQKRVLVLFGGESSAGVPTQQTYILQMDDLTWRVPNPPGSQLAVPPPRSGGVYGQDIASNYRAGMLVYGGRGGSGTQALDDLWYYHYQNEFWVQIPTSTSQVDPGARWGAVGGTAPASKIQNIETFMWLAGGENGTTAFDIDAVWQLSVNGVIAAGSNAASGVWAKVPATGGMGGGRTGLAGTVLPPIGTTDNQGTLVLFGGCPGSSESPCTASASSQILSLPSSSWAQAAQCPPASFGSSMAPNRNVGATTFGWEAFLFPSTGDHQGEVSILSANSGVWARVIPAADPSSQPGLPTFKEGATVYSHYGPIVGQGGWADTVVFGGMDTGTGQLTSELWLLRAYNGSVTSSNDRIPGTLQSGIGANGSGVQVTYLQDCATQTAGSPAGTSTSGPRQTGGDTNNVSSGKEMMDESPVNIVLSPLSVALFLPSILLFRASSSHQTKALSNKESKAFLGASALVGVIAYGIGIAGFALGWTQHSHYTPPNPSKRSSSTRTFLTTAHGRTSLALWITLYLLLPLFALVLWIRRPRPVVQESEEDAERRSLGINSIRQSVRERKVTDETTMLTATFLEKDRTSGESGADDDGEEFPSRRRNSKSLSTGTGMKRRSEITLQSVGTAPTAVVTPPTPTAKFEVMNRPKRTSMPASIRRNPSDLSWVDRAGNVNMYGQMDYELTEPRPATTRPPMPNPRPSSSGAHEVHPATPAVPALTPPLLPSTTSRVVFDILVQIVLFWALAFWIVSLAICETVAGLIILAVAALAYYTALLSLAWLMRPRRSILVVIVSRLRGDPTDTALRAEVRVDEEPELTPPSSPIGGRVPYIHSPPWRVADEARSIGTTEPMYDDEDDEVRQARMEEEMARRDVSIFTVPKKRLVVRN